MFKNVASQKAIFFAFDSTSNSPKTGDAANITAYVSKDYGAVTVLGDTTATEMDSTNAKGYYLFDLTQTETNADVLMFSAKSSTANIVVIGAPAVVFTDANNINDLVIDSSGNFTAGITGNVTGNLSGSVGSVTGAVGSVTGNVGGNVVGSVASVTGNVAGSVGSVVGAVGSVTGNVGGNVTGSVGSVATGGITRASFAADTGLQTVRSNTLQGSPAGNQVTLDASASAVDNLYLGAWLDLTGGTGVGQGAVITGYDGTTKIATLDRSLATTPDATTTFAILPFGGVARGSNMGALADLRLINGSSADVTNLVALATDYGNGELGASVAAVTGAVGSIAANGITSSSFAAGAIDAAAIADGAIDTATFAAGATIPRCTLVDTTTTNTDMVAVPTNFSSLSIDANGRVKIQSGVPKNTALSGFSFFMTDSSDHVSGKTGLTVTATRSLDGAAFASCANAVAEVANGVYKIDLAAADLNANTVTLKFTATGADARIIEIVTTP